ncbi:hypothetical protein OsJ_25263 [Oryza sativa Japonica Group]|uniref:Uncharacterized protein n=1 Tax=Oryza sativa subsp. japonica TaxID=39947 RepID=A3BMJ6_ORYSJ|nr:hypothetical protein OsJ_25263 [Oryza sativa Japonica Group]
MGRGRSRKPRNFATFRLCPRPGAADASDRVFFRVDNNPYYVPGFADDDVLGGAAAAALGEGDDDAPSSSASGETGPLPDHAYDASRVRIGSSGKETTTATAAAVEVEVTRIENAIDPDVARLLEESGEPALAGSESESESEDDDLEEDFVLVANQDDDDFVLVEIENQFEEEEENIAAADDSEEDGLKNGECKVGNSASA